MNYVDMDVSSIVHFPENICFENVPEYLNFLYRNENMEEYCFDLSGTEFLHSSFIGFLIYAKSVIEKNGKKLTLKLSQRAEYTFRMLNIYNHFQPNIIKNI